MSYNESNNDGELINPELELEKTLAMAESVEAFKPNTSGDPGGAFVPPGFEISVDVEHSWNGAPIPSMYLESGGQRERVYVHQAFLFHPDTARDLGNAGTNRPNKGARDGRIFVVDTGHVMGTSGAQNALARGEWWNVDPLTDDVAHEHGPAIVDMIKACGGSDVDVFLRQVRFDQSPSGFPVFTHPDPHPITGDPMKVRGFTEGMLIAALNDMADDLQEGDVVNLSLGAVAHPEALQTPGDEWIYNWLQEVTAQGVRVVVAAGNHGTTVPTWPAAHGTSVSPFGQLENVFAVGSSASGANDRHTFSAYEWVPHWENGRDVRFTSRGPQGQTAASWDGTSFAAPQFAVGLLPPLEDGTSNPSSPVIDRAGPAAIAKKVAVPAEPPKVVDIREAVTTGGRLKAMASKAMPFFRRR